MHGKSRQETEDVHRRNCISFCDTMAASEYCSLIRPFLDISTLFSKIEGGRMHFHRIQYV